MFVQPALSRTVLAHTSTYNLALSSFVFNLCKLRKIIDPVIRFLRASESRIKNRVIISAFVEWKTTIARVVRNRRVVAKNLLRRAKLHVATYVTLS